MVLQVCAMQRNTTYNCTDLDYIDYSLWISKFWHWAEMEVFNSASQPFKQKRNAFIVKVVQFSRILYHICYYSIPLKYLLFSRLTPNHLTSYYNHLSYCLSPHSNWSTTGGLQISNFLRYISTKRGWQSHGVQVSKILQMLIKKRNATQQQ